MVQKNSSVGITLLVNGLLKPPLLRRWNLSPPDYSLAVSPVWACFIRWRPEEVTCLSIDISEAQAQLAVQDKDAPTQVIW